MSRRILGIALATALATAGLAGARQDHNSGYGSFCDVRGEGAKSSGGSISYLAPRDVILPQGSAPAIYGTFDLAAESNPVQFKTTLRSVDLGSNKIDFEVSSEVELAAGRTLKRHAFGNYSGAKAGRHRITATVDIEDEKTGRYTNLSTQSCEYRVQ